MIVQRTEDRTLAVEEVKPATLVIVARQASGSIDRSYIVEFGYGGPTLLPHGSCCGIPISDLSAIIERLDDLKNLCCTTFPLHWENRE